MKKETLLLSCILTLGTFVSVFASFNSGGLSDPYGDQPIRIIQDTIPPITERYDNFAGEENRNPFDLEDPSVVEKEIEYDPITGQYIVTEKIGDEYYRMPSYMTFDEYMDYRGKEQERDYFDKLSGISTGGEAGAGILDPIRKFNINSNLLDRLFGGTEVDIQPQGSIDLTFAYRYQRVDNPAFTARQRRSGGGFDFDMDIRMNVTGKIGEKLNLSTNYNTGATLNLDNQMKLDYNTDQFSEDEIIKKIEAGDVSMPLRSNLIQGSQSLLGLKTELQFGRLWVTALASQKRSRQEEIVIEGGSQVQEFAIFADEYDENRHFFLSHYNRAVFEDALSNLPQIKTVFRIEKVQVWITNDRQETQNISEVVGLADLGEFERITANDNNTLFNTNPTIRRNPDITGQYELPSNESNGLYAAVDNPATRNPSNVIRELSNRGLSGGKDFDKVRARRLRPQEYTVNEQLGFISLNVNLRPDQVLGVAYSYFYNGKRYVVGDFWDDETGGGNSNATTTTTTQNPNAQQEQNTSNDRVLYLKMLKSTTPRVDLPAWDLMMKNIYATGAFNVDPSEFRLDVFYEDPGQGQKRFLPEGNLAGRSLLHLFNLDRLTVQRDPCPDGDGIFDFVEGVTISTRNGRVMFPVLEPFGSHLKTQITDPKLAEKYSYQMLYDSTVIKAREFPEFNRFTLRGTYKSDVSSEFSIGAFNLPQNSVRVYAGGSLLVEGSDYEVNYATGRVKILNDAYLSSGVPIRVSFEDNSLFGFQNKTMLGLRAEYRFNDDFSIGSTFMQLFERPFTQKVNIGDDPINNRVFGLDLSISKDAPWLTKLVDNLPLIETKAPSSISFLAEGAYLKPGHSKAINEGGSRSGSIYLDDFEGSASGFDLKSQPNVWFLASVPQNDEFNNNPRFPEGALINSTLSGTNRALMSWYRLDRGISCLTSTENPNTSYCAIIPQNEVFPNLQLSPGQINSINSLDIAYYPQERGPYNFDMPDGGTQYSAGLNPNGGLNEPETRWAGIMREITSNNNFEQANIEYIEVWMLSPFLATLDGSPIPDRGDLYFNIGNISEDILRDSRQAYENGLPGQVSNRERPTNVTNLGRVPISPPITPRAFDANLDNRAVQDVGLDGMNDVAERLQFASILQQYSQGSLTPNAFAEIEADPSNDNFVYYNAPEFQESTENPISFYKRFNNTEGNSAVATGQQINASTTYPDSEDLNQDNTLNETESYYEYHIPLEHDGDNGIVPNQYITDERIVLADAEDDQKVVRKWYRFKIPLDQYTAKVGGIQDFRSIRFMRMYVQGFDAPVALRFARLDLVRNQWRRYFRDLGLPTIATQADNTDNTLFDVNAISIEENAGRQPFNYVLPPGIDREQSLGAFPNIQQNEQALAIEVCDLQDGDARAIFKNFGTDLRLYDTLKMFVHGESVEDLQKGDLSIFMRLGSDYEENYYEYEIPLQMSNVENLPFDNSGGTGVNAANSSNSEYIAEVWREENEFYLPLDLLKAVKQERNAVSAPRGTPYEVADPDFEEKKVRVKGNPNLGLVKGIMIGIRNTGNDGISRCAEIWINELRVSGLEERGGGAALARLDVQLADFGSVNMSTNYSSVGWGGLEEKLAERSREEIIQYDVSTNLELGKLLPEESGVKVPFFAQYSTTVKTPEYDPYDLDLTLEEKIAANPNQRDSITNQALDVTTIKSYNFTNVRKERTNTERKPMPWDISNFSASYAYTNTEKQNPIIEKEISDEYTGSLNYAYAIKPLHIYPLKKVIKKDKYLKFLSEFHFNLLPHSFSVNTQLDRQRRETLYRPLNFDGSTEVNDENTQRPIDKRFRWDRNYSLNWDFTKSLKFTFNASNQAVVNEEKDFKRDENQQLFKVAQSTLRDTILESLRNLGDTRNYNHTMNLSYNVPLKNIFFLDWINLKAQYGSNYSWSAATENIAHLGNVLQNSQTRQLNADFNFETLYKKSKYLAKINRGNRKSKRGRGNNRISSSINKDKSKGKDAKKGKKKEKEVSKVEKALIRPLMLLRKVKFGYQQNFQTVLPGYMPKTRFLGMNPSFDAPGLDFIAGWQPDLYEIDAAGNDISWYQKNGRTDWITRDTLFNDEALQNTNWNYNLDVSIEPFDNFKLNLTAKKSSTRNESQLYHYRSIDSKLGIDSAFVHDNLRFNGMVDMSFSSFRTLFGSLSTVRPALLDDNGQTIINVSEPGTASITYGQTRLTRLFEDFRANRATVSQLLGYDQTHLDSLNYNYGFGKEHQDVAVGAFLSAYTGQSPETYIDRTNNTVVDKVFGLLPHLNWDMSYNGLSKIEAFKNIFSSFDLRHAYQSTLSVASFQTDLDYQANDPYLLDEANNYFSRYEIPQMVISEAFTPLIGVQTELVNGMTFDFEYSRIRELNMNFTDDQLIDRNSKEIVFGFGYTMKDVYIGFLKGDGGKKKKKKKDADPDDKKGKGGNLNFQFNLSFMDDATINYQFRGEQLIIEPTRGAKTISFSPTIDYDINESLNVQMFFDYRRTEPKTTASFPITNATGGFKVRFTLQ